MITSSANPLVKRLRSLAVRKHRLRESAFVVEGLQPVWRAVQAGWPLQQLVVAPGLIPHEGARRMVADAAAAGIEVVELSDELFSRLSERDGPSGIMAVAETRDAAWTDLGDGPVLALERVANPGNLGTVLRTADALGIAGVVTVGASTDPWSPAAVKASMGSVFAVPVVAAEWPDVRGWAEAQGRGLWATALAGSVPLQEAALGGRDVVVFGNEGDGLPDAIVAECDQAVRIPMTGTAESLNLATAVAMVCWEWRR